MLKDAYKIVKRFYAEIVEKSMRICYKKLLDEIRLYERV